MDRWTWRWIPDPPAQFGDNPPFDVLRLAVVLSTIVLALVIGRVIREQRRRKVAMNYGQVLRFVSLLLACVYVSLTELAVFGTPASPRLFIGLAMAWTGIRGVAKMRAEQRATPPVR